MAGHVFRCAVCGGKIYQDKFYYKWYHVQPRHAAMPARTRYVRRYSDVNRYSMVGDYER